MKWNQSTFRILLAVLAISVCGLNKVCSAQNAVQIAATEKEPYSGYLLDDYGYANEVVKRAFLHSGVKVDINFYPSLRAQHFTESGFMDLMVVSTPFNHENDEFVYSDPFPGGTLQVLKHQKTPLLTSDLINGCNVYRGDDKLPAKFGIAQGTSPTLLVNLSCNHHLTLQSDLQNILMLARQRVDYSIIDKYTASDLIIQRQPHLIGKLEFEPRLSVDTPFRIAVSKLNPRRDYLISTFNLGLKKLEESGELVNILNSHGFYYLPNSDENITTLVVGVPNINQIDELKRLIPEFLAEHNNLQIEWRVLKENILRKRLLSDMAIRDAQFDVVMIGDYETEIWAQNGWIIPLTNLPDSYDYLDILPKLRKLSEYKGQIYSLPFIAEHSVTYYRTDLLEQASLEIGERPTYQEIMQVAQKLHAPTDDIFGLGVRARAGWGQNMSYISTLVETFGGAWFDNNLQPQFTSQAWRDALELYVQLIDDFGPPQVTDNGWQENQKLFQKGHLAIMIDSSALAGHIYSEEYSLVSEKVAMAFAPYSLEKDGSSWLWSWSVAISSTSKQQDYAKELALWMTSKDYIELVNRRFGAKNIPPGTRYSSYENKRITHPEFARFVFDNLRTRSLNEFDLVGDLDIKSISGENSASPDYQSLPEFSAIAHQVGQIIEDIVAQKLTISEGLDQSQIIAERIMRKAGYYDPNFQGVRSLK